jgi:hypothetical protein
VEGRALRVPTGAVKERSSFLKKRTKKLLHSCRRLVRDSQAEVFASLFKKKRFLTLLPTG